MKRAFILLFDSFGIGEAVDAAEFGDRGANTFLHIAENYHLKLPNLARWGLYAAASKCAKWPKSNFSEISPIAAYGYAKELSFGKDTPSGHWEMMGVPVLFDWGYFPKEYPSFPEALIDDFIKMGGIPGILGNKAASGTVILDELGDEHVKTGKPIVYTSADSVFQIACHEETFGLERLYELCKIARKLVDPYNIGRIIARPFVGKEGHYQRTAHRHDYSVLPPSPTLLDDLKAAKGEVIGIGKIPDIFAHQGFTKEVPPSSGNTELFDAMLEEIKIAKDRSLIFTNFVDFDMNYGHRRDVPGYAKALETLDRRLPELEKIMGPDDVAIIAADHGCDPTFKGTDHTRENIPILVYGQKIKPGFIGARETFADIGQTLSDYFDLKPLKYGQSFLPELRV